MQQLLENFPMKTKLTQVERWTHPDCDEGLILIPGKDGATHEARRRLAAETMGANPDDLTLRYEIREMTAEEIANMHEFQG